MVTLPSGLRAKSLLKMPSILGDHMVLQAGSAALWGKDRPGQKVTVHWRARSVSTKADRQGHWSVTLPDLEPGGPYELQVVGSGTVVFRDVLVGEVWLGAGQSNMEFTVQEAHDAKGAIKKAGDPSLRLFLQGRVMALSPRFESEGKWVVCTPETVKDFSAALYFFGRELRGRLRTPVGLIAASWGGSFVESWMPEGALQGMPEAKTLIRDWRKKPLKERTVWSKGVFPDLRLSDIRFIPKDPKQAPLTVLLPGTSDEKALGGEWVGEAKIGSRTSFAVTGEKGPQGGPVGRFDGHLEGGAWGFVYTKFRSDDQPVDLSAYKGLEFTAKGRGEFFIFLPQPSIKDSCYWSSNPFKVTDKWKRVRIDFDELKHDAWGKPAPFTQDALQRLALGAVSPALSNVPSVLYNGMIAPSNMFRMRGVLWYQGEANEWAAQDYAPLLKAMIQSWREARGQKDLRFLICQLPEFRAKEKEPVTGTWALIREAHESATELPGVEMAVLLGLGDPDDIHPKNKSGVGQRMASVALANVYGREAEWTGPRYESARFEGPRARVSFRHVGGGLKAKDGELRGFVLAGKDGVFHWAKAKVEGSGVVVWCDEVKQPVAVRYAWADNPDGNLVGKNNLPAAPFRSDKPRR